MNPKEAINFIVRQIEAITVAAISAIRKTVFGVNVKNFPKTQDVKGSVVVANQKNVEELLRKLVEKDSTIKEVKIESLGKLDAKFEMRKDIEVNNFGVVLKALSNILEEIKNLKLNPTIEVAQPSITVSPAKLPPITIPEIKVPEIKIPEIKMPEGMLSQSTDPKGYIPVRLTDGEKFYEAIAHITGGLKRAQTISNIDPLGTYQITDVDSAGATKYYGYTDRDENWYIMEEATSAGTYRYARGTGSYATNWTGRAGLTYGYFHEAF